jgi:hypothetical protein
MSDRRSQVLLGITAVSLSLFCATSILTASDTYNPSFYNSFSPVTWVSFCTFLISGLASLATAQRTNDVLKLSVMIISGIALFWELPHLLNLPFWAPPLADMLMHYGSARFTIDTGGIWSGTIYPLVHVLLAQLSMVTKTPVYEIGSAFSLLVSITGITGLATVARRLFKHRQAGLVTAAAGGTLVFGKFYHNVFPWFTSLMLVLIVVLLLLIQTDSSGVSPARIAAIVLIVSITMMHPMTALVLFGVGTVFLFSSTMLSNTKLQVNSGTRFGAWLLVIPLIHYVWYFGQSGFSRKISTILLSVFGPSVGAAGKVGEAGTSGFSLIQLIYRFVILKYGPVLLIVGAGSVIVLVVIYRFIHEETTDGEVTAAVLFGAGLILATALLAFNAIATGGLRINQVTIIASLLLIGVALTRFQTEQVIHIKYIRVLVIGAVILTAIIAPFTVYPETYHTTQQEFTGTDWFLDNRNIEMETSTEKTTHKIEVFLQHAQLRQEVTYRTWAFGGPTGSSTPPHLGYDQADTVFKSVGPGYLITKTAGVEWWTTQPSNRYDDIEHYDRQDLRKLDNDTTSNLIYSTNGYKIWWI